MKIRKVIDKLKKKTRNISFAKEISYENLKKLIKNNSDIIIVDVRSPQEFTENRINTTINIPVYDIERMANSILLNKITADFSFTFVSILYMFVNSDIGI